MKEPYRWNYTIRVKTKSGEYTFEDIPLENIGEIVDRYPDHQGVEAVQNKKEDKGKSLVKTKTPKK